MKHRYPPANVCMGSDKHFTHISTVKSIVNISAVSYEARPDLSLTVSQSAIIVEWTNMPRQLSVQSIAKQHSTIY